MSRAPSPDSRAAGGTTDRHGTRNGVVYTPEKLSDFVAETLLRYLLTDFQSLSPKPLTVIDPAVGDGMLLASVARLIQTTRSIRAVSLYGVDIEPRATAAASRRLARFPGGKVTSHLVHANALRPLGRSATTLGWGANLRRGEKSPGFDLLIANPPWGADISTYRDKLRQGLLSTLKNHFDSYELFMELATRVVSPTGYFGFIIPDSILNHGKSALRDLLLERTELRYIARLGEGLFPGVYRGCVVLIGKNCPPTPGNLVDCFRLSSADRAKVLSDELSLSAAQERGLHRVPQSRFANNPYKQFDIDLRENEWELLSRIRVDGRTLGDALTSARGIELSSSGWICRCPRCGMFAPVSEKATIECEHCGSIYHPGGAHKTKITGDSKVPNSVPLIAGRDLKRYACTPSTWVTLGKPGIKYKSPETYRPPKILVRKTGVGITAVLDYTRSYTTQVVYILREKTAGLPALEFFIGLLNSRIYHFVLSKSFGELEWRSHPYLTQSQLLSLPLPNLDAPESRSLADRIARVLKEALAIGKPNPSTDAEVEALVGRLFLLTPTDLRTIFASLNEADELLPVKELKEVECRDVERYLR